ncbi:hypothetical protein OKA05_28245 [Luteolibacter arcticus]|uniref:Lipocalin-like domain-containing protein n=1 Tax=Luteolibacter arcticus TaxID=1581411 RepID=A0ABT3GSK8_9BACT|nr:hypothetical protein [Luteolibacter arcticus]MCW1926475.1 hypothetical protein [Luteolibacter arcticus]
MKLTLLATAALCLSPALASADAPSPSPVGTWEVALSGADQGTAYVTFEEDHDFTAYGLSRESLGLFTLSGTWTITESGQLAGSYTETINGGTVTGSLAGKVAKGKISGSITATNGKFTFKAKPETDTQNLTGAWTGIASIGKQRLPGLYQLTPSSLPHVYQIDGGGISPTSGSYSIHGTVLAGANGKVELVAFSMDAWGSAGFSSLTGTVSAKRKQNVLKGKQSNGSPVKIALTR